VRKRILIPLLLLVSGGGVYIAKVSWYDRYVERPAPAHMLDLPPVDRSRWPAQPLAWREETQCVEVATPEGNVLKEIHYHVNSLNMDFVHVPAGSFRPIQQFRGNPPMSPYRRAAHVRNIPPAPLITLSHDYYLGAFEVTNAQFELFDPGHRGRRVEYQRGERYDNHPVDGVTWQEAQQFARWLSEREGRLYRLPTAAEWERAAAAGTETRLYWGEAHWDRSKANLGGLRSNRESYRLDGFKETSPVGFFPANPWGLYDMIGNAYEWVQDWWHGGPSGDVTDPVGPAEGRIRMDKGGSWTTRYYMIYTGESDGDDPGDLPDARGFRLLVEIE